MHHTKGRTPNCTFGAKRSCPCEATLPSGPHGGSIDKNNLVPDLMGSHCPFEGILLTGCMFHSEVSAGSENTPKTPWTDHHCWPMHSD